MKVRWIRAFVKLSALVVVQNWADLVYSGSGEGAKTNIKNELLGYCQSVDSSFKKNHLLSMIRCFMIILELWYCGELAVVFLVPGLPCLNLTLFAAIPLGPALGVNLSLVCASFEQFPQKL